MGYRNLSRHLWTLKHLLEQIQKCTEGWIYCLYVWYTDLTQGFLCTVLIKEAQNNTNISLLHDGEQMCKNRVAGAK